MSSAARSTPACCCCCCCCCWTRYTLLQLHSIEDMYLIDFWRNRFDELLLFCRCCFITFPSTSRFFSEPHYSFENKDKSCVLYERNYVCMSIKYERKKQPPFGRESCVGKKIFLNGPQGLSKVYPTLEHPLKIPHPKNQALGSSKDPTKK